MNVMIKKDETHASLSERGIHVERYKHPISFVNRLARLGHEMRKHYVIYLLVLPGIVWYIIFTYVPMGGLMLAFKQYRANKGILRSPWIGLTNFERLFRNPEFIRASWRTLIINLGRLAFEFPVPIILAILLNEVRMARYKKAMQVIMTFPNFLSWVVIASILTSLLSLSGPVNSILELFGLNPVPFLGKANLFIPILYVTSNWKGMGWASIIYLAAIAGIDQEQYEAGEIDGASRLQRILYITLPCIFPTISIMLILDVGDLMSGGFDQIFNLATAPTQAVSEVLDIYIYRITFQSAPDFGFSMAISLFRSVINLVLLLIADKGAKWLGGTGLIG